MDVPADLMARYRERRKVDLEVCMSSLEHQEFSVLENIGHQLKGNGCTFGHPELSLIGQNLELAAQSHDMGRLQKTMKDFSEWVNSFN